MLTFVVAVADNNVMGSNNQLPWRLPADLRRFKALTMGKPMIMGRKTYDSIGKPLPGRANIVVTRQPGLHIPGCVVVDSLDSALQAAGDVPEVAIIGGAQIYREALSRVDIIHLTRVHARIPGNIYFPELAASQWCEREIESHPADERHAYPFSFVELTRRRGMRECDKVTHRP